MIERYTLPEMGVLWTERFKKEKWHKVELAALRAQDELNFTPRKTYMEASRVVIDEKLLKRADELEAISDHDYNAFCSAVSEKLEDPLYHQGMTSYDGEDTALALILMEAIDLIGAKLDILRRTLWLRAQEHKYTLMIGRTHGIHAEVITFGFKLLGWIDVIERHQKYLASAREEARVGKFSGAVGIYSLPPEVELKACEYLGLRPARISTQIISRDILVHLASVLAAIANSLEKFSTEIRLLASTDVSEVAEYKKPGAQGSSAMPGKSKLRNPIKSENTTGLAWMSEAYLQVAFKCEILWGERTLPNSAPERIYLPDLFILVDFMLKRFADTMEKLEVFPAQMERNIWRTGGIVFAQPIMLALIKKGMSRPQAYKMVEGVALSVEHGSYQTTDGKTFKDLIFEHNEITKKLSDKELAECFNPRNSIKHLPQIFVRFGL